MAVKEQQVGRRAERPREQQIQVKRQPKKVYIEEKILDMK
jgi:hypothetical protein